MLKLALVSSVRLLKFLCPVGALLILTALTPATASADPLVITSGTLTITGLFGGPQFNLVTDSRTINGGGDKGSSSPQACAPCSAGSSLSVFGFFAGSSLGGGGVGGTFTLTGPPVLVPNLTSDVTLTSTFSFIGHMIFCPTNCAFEPPTFSLDLVGGGTVNIDLQYLFSPGGNPVFQFRNVTYTFETPEPMSILLLGGGLAGLAAKLHRKRSQSFK